MLGTTNLPVQMGFYSVLTRTALHLQDRLFRKQNLYNCTDLRVVEEGNGIELKPLCLAVHEDKVQTAQTRFSQPLLSPVGVSY